MPNLNSLMIQAALRGVTPERPTLLSQFKDNLGLYAILAGSVYGLGWLSVSVMIAHLGLGAIAVSHEQAVAAGLSTCICLAPILIVFAGRAYKPLQEIFLPNATWRSIIVSLLFFAFNFIVLFKLRDAHLIKFQEVAFPNRAYLAHLLLDAALSVIVYHLLRACYLRISVSSKLALVILLISAISLKWNSFVNQVLPCTAHVAGGLLAQDMYLGLKPTKENGTDLPGIRFHAFLLAQDDRFIVFAHGFRYLNFEIPSNSKSKAADLDTSGDLIPARIYKLPISDIAWIRQPTGLINQFRNKTENTIGEILHKALNMLRTIQSSVRYAHAS